MMIQALLVWWYGAGWAGLARKVTGRIDAALGFFSVGLLLRTLFDPFRQIGAGRVRGSLQIQFSAWLDRAFSRCVGFVVRSCVVIFGVTVAGLLSVAGLAQLLLWPIVPVLPVIGIALAVMRVGK